MSDILNTLNPTQKEAVIDKFGPSLIIAGAGSGKTRVLTNKIAYLLETGEKPYRILALTFTNKAAREMSHRISEMIDRKKSSQLWMGTFHSIFSKILRVEAEKIGFTSSFSIYDTEDSKSLIASIVKEMQLDSQTYKTNEMLSQISMAKNNLITPAAYATNGEYTEIDRFKKRPFFSEIYNRYFNKCKNSNVLDFDDLLLYTNILFRDNLDILRKYQEKFDFILVDEYQDTNFAQYLIVKKLSALKKNISVVGDDSQSIYSFRGAKIENILNFKSDFPEYKLYKLEQNYRSTKNIVNAANSLIENNKGRIPKVVWSENENGDKIKILKCYTDAEESYAIADEITRIYYDKKVSYSSFAILYRTNSQSRIFEEVFLKKNIPYKIFGSISFYQRKEIKDILAYLRLISNSKDDESLKRIINFPHRGIGETSIGKISQLSSDLNCSLFEALSVCGKYNLNIRGKTLDSINYFVSLITEFEQKIDIQNAYDLTEDLFKRSGIFNEIFNTNNHENIERAGNVEQLLSSMQSFCNEENEEFPSIVKFLESVSLLTDADTNDKDSVDRVTLMTVHSSKGLEYEYVFIVGAEEDLFPFYLSKDSVSGIEEERRLFYVALTRACKRAFISFTEQRFRFGNYIFCNPSRFITEIDEKFLDIPSDFISNKKNNLSDNFDEEFKNYNNKSSYNKKTEAEYKPVFQSEKKLKKISDISIKQNINDNNIDYKVGMKVVHEKFGIGNILSIDGVFPNTKLIVDFEIDGKKNLLAKFAKLNILQN